MDPVPLWFGGTPRCSRSRAAGTRRAQRIGYSRIAPGYFGRCGSRCCAGVTSRARTTPRRRRSPSSTRRWRGASGPTATPRAAHPDGDAVIEIVGIAADAKYGSLADRRGRGSTCRSRSIRPTTVPVARGPDERRPACNLRAADRARGACARPELAGLPVPHARRRPRAATAPAASRRDAPRRPSAAFGLLLAAIGVYGVMAYRRQAADAGDRHPSGARRADLQSAGIGDEARHVRLPGSAPPSGFAWRWSRHSFWRPCSTTSALRIQSRYAAVLMFLLGVAALACYLPARQVGKVNPLDALRAD